MRTLITFFMLTALTLTLTAGELTGKWSGKFDITNSNGETKPDPAYMSLKLDASTVTGTAGPNEDEQWAIRKGKLEAGKLTFEVVMEEDGGDSGTLVFDLVYDGDTIRGNCTGSGQNGEKMSAKLDLKRAS